jgi:putative ABC transport system permease protein
LNAVEGRVRGIFRPVAKALGDAAIQVPIDMARSLIRVTGSHAWVVLLKDTDETEATIAKLRTKLPESRFQVVHWMELSDFYVKTVALFSRQMTVVKLIVALIILLSISNTMMMSVLERTAEIGTSMAMGTRRRGILGLFVAEGVVMGAVGGLAGVLLGYGLAQLISWIGIPMPPPPGMSSGYTGKILVGHELLLECMVLAVATTAIASLYPAWKASRLRIVDALRHSR